MTDPPAMRVISLESRRGTEMARLLARHGLTAIEAPLHEARKRKLLDDDARRLRPTQLGRRFLNDVVALFLPNTQ